MTALPNQVKETPGLGTEYDQHLYLWLWLYQMEKCNQDDQLCASGDAYTSIDFPLFRTADAYLMAAEAILRGANGTETEALGYVNEVRSRAYMSGKYAKSGVRSDVSEKSASMNFL